MNRQRQFRSWWSWFAIAIVTACFLGGPQRVEAQPSLNFARIVSNWPTIELYFKVSCRDQLISTFDKDGNFKVYENGLEVGTFTLWCPDPRQRCAISVALVFDASGSMTGNGGNAGAIAAGNAFVNLMDGMVDEAAIIWFSGTPHVQLSMTSNKTELRNAINALPADGTTALWDGMYVGLQELIRTGSNPCRAMIAMTDGQDNASSNTAEDIIALASRNRIRVFTIGLGDVQSELLEMIAYITGGKYFSAPTAEDLTVIYREISSLLLAGFEECVITYKSQCQDGTTRTVDLTVLNIPGCVGSDTQTRTYKAPKDTGTHDPITFALGSAKNRGGHEAVIPLELKTNIQPAANLYPSTFTILFNSQCIQLVQLETPPGTLFHDVPMSIEPIAGGIRVKIEQTVIVQGSGKIADLTFRLSDPDDTTCCPIMLATWVFEAGCFKPLLEHGEICIVPKAPIVTCRMEMPSEIEWVRSAKDYIPNPFNVKMTVLNAGDREARNIRFKIDYDPASLELQSPVSSLQPGTPVMVPVNGTSEVIWSVRAKTRLTQALVEVCITAMMDNHADVVCCLQVLIPPTEPVLECTMQEVVIHADNENQRYTPMPFTLTVNVLNRGGMKTDSVFATIILSGDLELAGDDAPDRNTKKLMPGFLLPNQSGSASWQLTHPITLQQTDYVIQVWVKTSNADSSLCEVKVSIPPLDAPSIRATCIVPESLVFDENIDPFGEYVPNPFNVTLTARNLGQMGADNVSGFLHLPENMEFDPQGQNPTFNFGTMERWQSGAPVPSQTWSIRWTKRFRYNTVAAFKWAVGGIGRTGVPIDSVYTFCETTIPGLTPAFTCSISAPNYIGLNAAQTGNEPNPFELSYTVRNTSKQVAAIRQIVCYFPHDGIALSETVPGNDQARIGNWLIHPNEEVTFTWTFNVTGRIVPRNLNMLVIAVDDEDNPISCQHGISVEPLNTALMCNLEASAEIITYNQILQDYDNPAFTVTATLTNTGGFNLANVTATIKKAHDPENYLELDPDFADNSNPKSRAALFQDQMHPFSWGYRLAKPNTSGIVQIVELTVAYASNETPLVEDACNILVQINPVLVPALVCELVAPDTIFFNTGRYEPDEFDVHLRVVNPGNGDAENVVAYILQDERFTVIPGSSIRELPRVPRKSAIEFSENEGFQVRVKPRATSGYDTLRVVVVADGIPSALCEYAVWVEAEKRPMFDLVCTPDTALPLSFHEGLNGYVPNPFTITTEVTNIGDAVANDCEIVFIGPRKFVPVIQNSVQPFNTPSQKLGAGEKHVFVWNMEALRQDSVTTELMIFQVRGKGGIMNDIIFAECAVPVMIPPARAARYEMVCTSPSALRYNPGTSSYDPDPFDFTVDVTNVGHSEGREIKISLADFPSRIFLADGEANEKTIPSIPVNETRRVTWQFHPAAESYETRAEISATLVDLFNNHASCMSETLIPPATEPTLTLQCAPEFDSLTVDNHQGVYLPRNPFEVYLTITNDSQNPIYDVVAELTVGATDLSVVSPAQVSIAQVMQPGDILTRAWDVRSRLRSQSGNVPMTFRVTSSNVAAKVCGVVMHIPATGQPALDCTIMRLTDDEDFVLNFLPGSGDYEGDLHEDGYTYFTIQVNVMNVGEARAEQVRVRIAPLDGGATLLDGESPTKPLEQDDNIVVSGVGTARWRLKPIRIPASANRRFEVIVTSANAEVASCIYEMTIEGAPKVVEVSLPEDAIGQYGDKILVPVYMSPTIGRDVNVYKLNVKYDPSVIRFVESTNVGSQTEFGWSGPRTHVFTVDGSTEPNLVRVQDFTTGWPLASKTNGILTSLIFEAVYGGEKATMLDFATAGLEFVLEFTDGGRIYRSSMNSVNDGENGDITLNLIDGLVTVSGSCIVPLNSSLKFQLAQNKPNPFNPSTVIEYTVGIDSRVNIDIYDAVGRHVKTLVNEHQKAGNYRRTFDASGLPSGTYLYKLETPHYTETKRMVLTR